MQWTEESIVGMQKSLEPLQDSGKRWDLFKGGPTTSWKPCLVS